MLTRLADTCAYIERMPTSCSSARPTHESPQLGYARAVDFIRELDQLQSTALLSRHKALSRIWGPREAVSCQCVSFIHVYKASALACRFSIARHALYPEPPALQAAGSFAMSQLKDICPSTSVHHPFWKLPEALRRAWIDKQQHRTGDRVLLSMVRDPVDHAVSSLHELVARGLMRRGATLEEYADRIRSHGFWNDHVFPQYVQLLSPLTGLALPLTFLGRSEFASDVTSAASWHLNVTPPAASADAQGWRIHSSTARPDAFAVWPTLNDTRALCDIYYLDYRLLRLPWPRACLT